MSDNLCLRVRQYELIFELYVLLCYRLYRGYRVRKENLLARKPKRWKKRIVPSRFSLEVYRRIWGRSEYEPVGGWPGRKDTLKYDMWEHIDKPPKGRQFGLRTRKVLAVPRSEKEKDILMHDHNAWVGVPIAWEAEESEGVVGKSVDEENNNFISDIVAKDRTSSKPLKYEGDEDSPSRHPKIRNPTILDNLLETTPYKDPVVKMPGYVPIPAEELMASFAGGMNSTKKDKLLASMFSTKYAAKVYDEKWLDKSVAAQDKACKAQRRAEKAIEAENKRNAMFLDTMQTYRGVLNEINGEFSLISEMTGSSAMSHLLQATTPWAPLKGLEEEKNERNYGKVITDKYGKRPIVQATPIRGARKPLTKQHKVTSMLEQQKAEEHKQKQLILAADAAMNPDNSRPRSPEGGSAVPLSSMVVTGKDSQVSLDAPYQFNHVPVHPHTILLGEYGRKNYLMSKQSRKVIEHSRWSLMQHKYNRAHQAQLNIQRNKVRNDHASVPIGSKTLSMGGRNRISKQLSVNTMPAGGLGSPSVKSNSSPPKRGFGLVKGSEMENNDFGYSVGDDVKKGSHARGKLPSGMSPLTYVGSNPPSADWTQVDTSEEIRQNALYGENATAASGLTNPNSVDEEEMEALMGYWTSSPWGILKQQVADETPVVNPVLPFADDVALKKRTLYKPPKEVLSKVRVWPKKSRKHFKLRYTWLPQPLVSRAAVMVYDKQAVEDIRAPIAPISVETPVFVEAVPGAVSPPSIPSPEAESRWKHSIDDEELTQATNLTNQYSSHNDEMALNSPEYAHQEVGGKRWTRVVSTNRGVGDSSPEGNSPDVRRANNKPIGSGKLKVNVNGSSVANSSKKSNGIKSAARSRSKYHNISLSSSEDDDDMGYINIGSLKRSQNSFSPKTNVDDGSRAFSAFTDSITTLPASSHFSIKGKDISGSDAPSSNSRKRSNKVNKKDQYNPNDSSIPSTSSAVNDKSTFNPDYYVRAGHVVPKTKRTRGIGGAAIIAPISSPPKEAIHPYSWL